MTPTLPRRRTGRPRSGRSRCLCGCPWAQHQTHHRGKPCTRCACEHYAARPRPSPPVSVLARSRAPAPVVQLAPDAARLDCQPDVHSLTGTCPACQAWDHGKVLLQDGTAVSKTLWVSAHEAGRRSEAGV